MLKKLIALAATMPLIWLSSTANAQYETSNSNTVDSTTWAGSTDWDGPTASPGSNAGGTATDNVIFSHHETGSGTQTYRVDSNVGEINNLAINGGTATGNSGAGDHVQLQMRTGGALTVNGTTTLGENELGSIFLGQGGAHTLSLLGDIEIHSGAAGQGLNSFIEHTAENVGAQLIIAGTINGYNNGTTAGGGGVDLRINSTFGTTGVVFNTTGGTTTDTNAQIFNLDDFGVGTSGSNDSGVFTLGAGKTVNADDVVVGNNFAGATAVDRAVTGQLTIENTTVTAFDDGVIGQVSNTPDSTQIRTAQGTINVNSGAMLTIGDDLQIGTGSGSTTAANQGAEGTVNINGGGMVAVNDDVNLGVNDNTTGNLNIIDGSLTTAVGHLNIGGNGNTGTDVNAVGVVDVGASGTLTVGDGNQEQHIFVGRDGMGTMTSAGMVNVTDGDLRMGDSTSGPTGETNTLTVTGGSFNVSEETIVGMTAGNSGIVNVNGGTFTTGQDLYLGGNSASGVDAGSEGTLNVGAGGTVNISGPAEEHLYIGRSGMGTVTSAGTVNITNGDVRMGDNSTATGATNTLNVTGGTFTVSEETIVGMTAGNSGIVNVTGGTFSSGEDIYLGGNSNSGADAGSEGTLNVGAGGIVNVSGTGEQHIYIGRSGMGTVNSAGIVNITDGDVRLGENSTATGATNTLNVTGGTFTVSEQIIAGYTAGNSGDINVTGGTLNVGEEIYLGGNSTDGTDDDSSGSLRIGTGGVVSVNDGIFPGLNQNVEVGRDGSGVLDVDGGTLNIYTGNLVAGQTSSATFANNARGTVTFQNGAIVNVGDTYAGGSNADGLQNNFNINAGGADVIHSTGAIVRIEQDLQMQFTNTDASTNDDSTYTISDSSMLELGRDFNARNNSTGSNTLEIIGGDTDIDVGRDLDIDVSSFELVFDFDGTNDSIFDFNLDVGRNAEVDGATLTFQDTAGDLSSYSMDILLVDVFGTTSGVFANAAQGQVFGAYMLTYTYDSATMMDGGGQDIALIFTPVPEPSALALVGLGLLGCGGRRRRKSAETSK